MRIGAKYLPDNHDKCGKTPEKRLLEHFNFLCIVLGRDADESGKAKNAANAIIREYFQHRRAKPQQA